MRCPKCGNVDSRVLDSRQAKDGSTIRRRRACGRCHYRFTTYEAIERAEFMVRKRDGRIEAFDRRKLMGGIEKACEKRPVSTEQIEKVVEDTVAALESRISGREVDSQEIGTEVMHQLHLVDGVAYVRYASVYRQFQDVGEFIDEIQSLGTRQRPDSAQPELFEALWSAPPKP